VTGRPNLRWLIAAALVVSAGGAAVATAASVPTIRLNHPCYLTSELAVLHGSGFDPSRPFFATLDGVRVKGHGVTDSTGAFKATFGAPGRLRRGSKGEDLHRLVVKEGAHVANDTFLVTHLSAGFSPNTGNPSTLRVRFRLLGWGQTGTVWLHYLNPKGTDVRNRFLGPTQGACGHLTTSPLKLFPFTPKKGVWRLQFDKSSVYKPAAVPRVLIKYGISLGSPGA
jgi:hypothetical protein